MKACSMQKKIESFKKTGVAGIEIAKNSMTVL